MTVKCSSLKHHLCHIPQTFTEEMSWGPQPDWMSSGRCCRRACTGHDRQRTHQHSTAVVSTHGRHRARLTSASAWTMKGSQDSALAENLQTLDSCQTREGQLVLFSAGAPRCSLISPCMWATFNSVCVRVCARCACVHVLPICVCVCVRTHACVCV